MAKNTKAKAGLPPLKEKNGTWAREPQEKAELFLKTFTGKYKLPPPASLDSSELGPRQAASLSGFLPVRARNATQVLRQLKEDSATGPDLLAAKVLRRCARALGKPVAKLARLSLNAGRWPKLRRVD